LPTRDPYLPTTYSTPAMSIGKLATDVPIPNVTILLQRLAVPHLPPNGTPGPTYNPYITVDYVDGVPVSAVGGVPGDSRLFNDTRIRPPAAMNMFASYGRKQPYAAHASQFSAQATNTGPGQPVTSFFNVNNPADVPFAWLTHLDRPLVNQIELRQVSSFK